jgi:hypothetical protein
LYDYQAAIIHAALPSAMGVAAWGAAIGRLCEFGPTLGKRHLTYGVYAVKRQELTAFVSDTSSKIQAELQKQTQDSRFRAEQLAIEAQKMTSCGKRLSPTALTRRR